MKKKMIVLLLGSALVLSACGKEETSAPAPEKEGSASASSAEGVYEKSCASCHGGNLQGGRGPDLTKVGSKYDKDEITKIINDGRGGMPKGVIQGDSVDKMAQWLADKK